MLLEVLEVLLELLGLLQRPKGVDRGGEGSKIASFRPFCRLKGVKNSLEEVPEVLLEVLEVLLELPSLFKGLQGPVLGGKGWGGSQGVLR